MTSPTAGDSPPDLSTLAHDIRGLLVPVLNALTIIRYKVGAAPDMCSALDMAERQLAAIRELLRRAVGDQDT